MTTPPPDGSADRPLGGWSGEPGRHSRPDWADDRGWAGEPSWAAGAEWGTESHGGPDRVNGTSWSTDDQAPWPDPWAPAPPPPGPRRRPLRAALVAFAVALGAAVLGVPYGFLWAALAPDPELIKVTGGFYPRDGLYPVDLQPEQFVAGDGWFVLIGVGVGALAAVATWLAFRRWRGPLVMIALCVGAVAGGLVAYWIGHRIGLAEFDRLVAQAPEGARLTEPAELRIAERGWWFGVVPKISGVLLAEAFGAAVAFTLLAGWSRHPTLRPAPPPVERLAPWDTTWAVSSEQAGQRAGTTAPAPPAPGEAGPPPARE